MIPNEYETIMFNPSSNLEKDNMYTIKGSPAVYGISIEEEEALTNMINKAFSGGGGAGGRPLVQCRELIDMVTLVPTGKTASNAISNQRSVLLMTLVAEPDGNHAVQFNLSVTCDVMLGGSAGGLFKKFNVALDGLFKNGQYGFIDHALFSGMTHMPEQGVFYKYRVNLNNEMTNNLEFWIQGIDTGVVTAKCHFLINFTLPNNADYAIGIPFPEVELSRGITNPRHLIHQQEDV